MILLSYDKKVKFMNILTNAYIIVYNTLTKNRTLCQQYTVIVHPMLSMQC